MLHRQYGGRTLVSIFHAENGYWSLASYLAITRDITRRLTVLCQNKRLLWFTSLKGNVDESAKLLVEASEQVFNRVE